MNQHANTIYHQGHDAEGKRVAYGARSTSDPHRDLHIMSAALELTQAVNMRGVDIDPFTFYRLVVGKPYHMADILVPPGLEPQHAANNEELNAVDLLRVADRTLNKLRGLLSKSTDEDIVAAVSDLLLQAGAAKAELSDKAGKVEELVKALNVLHGELLKSKDAEKRLQYWHTLSRKYGPNFGVDASQVEDPSYVFAAVRKAIEDAGAFKKNIEDIVGGNVKMTITRGVGKAEDKWSVHIDTINKTRNSPRVYIADKLLDAMQDAWSHETDQDF